MNNPQTERDKLTQKAQGGVHGSSCERGNKTDFKSGLGQVELGTGGISRGVVLEKTFAFREYLQHDVKT